MRRFFNYLKYKFDVFFSKGMLSLIATLFLIVLISIFTIAGITYLINPEMEFFYIAWNTFSQVLTPSKINQADGKFTYLIMMVIATFIGIFITSLFITFILNGFRKKVENLQRGRSQVIEKNHTLILGWSDNVFTILKELVEANKSKKKGIVVILSHKDSMKMNEKINTAISKLYTTKIICRTGSIYNEDDLKLCNISAAKSIMIIEKDLNAIKALLVVANTNYFAKSTGHISMIMDRKENVAVAKKIAVDQKGNSRLEVLHLQYAISRIIAQTSLHGGLSYVYEELLNFTAHEIYFYPQKGLAGLTFADLRFRFPNAIPIGISRNGEPYVNPDFAMVIEEKDEIIVIAEDDDNISPPQFIDLTINQQLINKESHETSKSVECIAIIGKNSKVFDIIREYENYLLKGSRVKCLVSSEAQKATLEAFGKTLNNITVEAMIGETYNRAVIDRFISANSSRIIILANEDTEHLEKDSQTLLTLLHLRDIEETRGQKLHIISEIEDVNNTEIVDLAKTDDFVISESIASKMITQISENKYLTKVFVGLLAAEGSEIYIKPIEQYLINPTATTFNTLIEAAYLKEQIAIGYICYHSSSRPEILLNPPKDAVLNFKAGDKLIVLAED